MEALNQSVDVDSALWREDIAGSRAHVHGLERAGVLSTEERQAIERGFDQIAREIDSGDFVWDPAKEDVHMNIESRLREICGPVGGKLHTGRSRNDQVATDLRLFCKRKLKEVDTSLRRLGSTLVTIAEREIDVLMPAYTHLQRGQPSRLSHHLMAWEAMLWRDAGRLRDALVRLDESPLGSGAAAGTGFPLDREFVASELGFARPTENSLDATASRDFLMEVASALAILGIHLSRIGEEVVVWSSTEFGFVRLDDRFATSSSMMPQKKNPDVAELVRGKAARLVGSLTTLLMLEKSLPLGYGRDLQEDKVPTFEAFQSVLLSLNALEGTLRTATFVRERLEGAVSRGHVGATDLADHLVLQGVPFRDAHGVVGTAVRAAEERGVDLSELSADVLAAVHPELGTEGAMATLEPRAAVERRSLIGGPAQARVAEAIARGRRRWS